MSTIAFNTATLSHRAPSAPSFRDDIALYYLTKPAVKPFSRKVAAAEDTGNVRTAHSEDVARLLEIAELDSKQLPAGELIVAEINGSVVAAISLENGQIIADPFQPSAGAVKHLKESLRR